MAAKDEQKKIQITLDNKNVEILKAVDSIHRESLINLGIALVSKTPYYQTLTGNTPDKLSKVTSLEVGGVDALDDEEDDTPSTKVEDKKTTDNDVGFSNW